MDGWMDEWIKDLNSLKGFIKMQIGICFFFVYVQCTVFAIDTLHLHNC